MEDDPEPLDAPAFRGERCPVAIIGGGLAGWSAAWWLGRAGIPAVVIDPASAPEGASARNAGFLMTGTAFSYEESISMWGREEARRMERLSWENRELLASHILPRVDCDAARSGTWRLSETAEEESELRRSYELLVEDGFDYRWLEREEARSLGHRFHGGMEQDGDWCLHPRKLVRGIARLAGQPLLRRRAVAVTPAGAGSRISLEDGTVLEAERCIATLNGYSGSLFSRGSGIEPVRAQVLLTEPLERQVWARPVYSHYGYFYFRQLRDGRLLVGGARHLHEDVERGLEDLTTEALQRDLEAFLRSIVPDAPPVDRRWSGVMGFTADSRPMWGPLPEQPANLLLGGFNGHGLGLAFVFSRLLIKQEFGGAL